MSKKLVFVIDTLYGCHYMRGYQIFRALNTLYGNISELISVDEFNALYLPDRYNKVIDIIRYPTKWPRNVGESGVYGLFDERDYKTVFVFKKSFGRPHKDIPKDSIFIMIKPKRHVDLEAHRICHDAGGQTWIDVIDACITTTLLDYSPVLAYISPYNGEIEYSGVICVTSEMCDYFSPRRVVYIPHHWDPRLKLYPFTLRGKEFELAYIGDKNYENSLYLSELGIRVIPFVSDLYKNYKSGRFVTCHYSVRRRGSMVSRYKSAIKVLTAGILESNIIVSGERNMIDILGSDYPYMLRDESIESVMSMINYARTSYGGSEWERGLRILRGIVSKLGLSEVAEMYKDIMGVRPK